MEEREKKEKEKEQNPEILCPVSLLPACLASQLVPCTYWNWILIIGPERMRRDGEGACGKLTSFER